MPAKANHTAILSDKKVALDHEYFATNLSEQILDAYFDRKGEFMQFIEDSQQQERERSQAQQPLPTQNSNPNTGNSASVEAHSLPKLNLPKFSGKFAEWKNFRDLFRSVVHHRTDLDASIKYCHLRTNLTGEAIELIKSISIAADHYDLAWQTLTTYYDNNRRIVNNLAGSSLDVKPMKVESMSELKRVNRELFGPVESFRKLGRSDGEIGKDLIVHIAVQLFDNGTKKEWKKSLDKSNDTPPTIAQLKEFIKGQIENLDDGKEPSENSSYCSKNKNKVKLSKGESELSNVHSLQTSSSDTSKNPKCPLCNAEHNRAKCEQFAGKSVAERQDFAKNRRACFNCLSTNHTQHLCRSRFNYFTRKVRHHTLLHLEKPESESKPNNSSVASNQSSSSVNCANLIVSTQATGTTHTTQIARKARVLLATALVSIRGPNLKQLTVRAFIDPCSQVSLVTQNLCNQLALTWSETRVCVQGVGEKGLLIADKLALLQITPHFESSFSFDTEALVLPKLSAYKPPVIRAEESFHHLKGLQLADPRYLEHTRIELLLGADVYGDIVGGEVIRGAPNQPIVMSSKLGWLLTGKCSSNSVAAHAVSVMHCTSVDVSNAPLHCLLEEFWRAEEISTAKNSYTKEEKACEDLFAQTTKRQETGRYIVRLPWKNAEYANTVKLGSSYPRALGALRRLEANFLKNKNLEIEYRRFMKEYQELGHMSVVEDIEPSSDLHYYFLPHHGVWNEVSSTTKMRTVFNGSSKFHTGESLNELLHSGRNFLPHPVDLVCSIRNYQIALSAEVEKMFRQVDVDERDRRLQTIIWRLSPLEPIRMYLLNTLTYGLTCSQYLAIRTLLQMAVDHKAEHPIAAAVVRDEMYSDNVLTGAHSIIEAQEKVLDLVNLFKKAQMNLRKWSANEPQVLSSLSESMLAKDRITLFNPSSSIPVLGIAWHTSGDYFCFHLESITIENPITKRSILLRIARICDPLGWIAPVTIVAKILMQSLWLHKLSWDQELLEEIRERWCRWVKELPVISELRIPRWTGYTLRTTAELHGFADASTVAYGAVLHLRLIQGQSVTTSLQVAKSRVAPIKTLSIPRLELCAALMLTRLARKLLDTTKLVICDTHLLTDSADVPFWLRDHPSRWNVFVANRCSEIHTTLPNAFWHHVKSQDNPADAVSRGLEPTQLQKSVLWWQGPPSLTKVSGAWSKEQNELNFSVASD